MIILIKLFLNSKLDFIRTVKFVKQLFRIQIQKGGKVLLWNKVKFGMEACYSKLVLPLSIHFLTFPFVLSLCGCVVYSRVHSNAIKMLTSHKKAIFYGHLSPFLVYMNFSI